MKRLHPRLLRGAPAVLRELLGLTAPTLASSDQIYTWLLRLQELLALLPDPQMDIADRRGLSGHLFPEARLLADCVADALRACPTDFADVAEDPDRLDEAQVRADGLFALHQLLQTLADRAGALSRLCQVERTRRALLVVQQVRADARPFADSDEATTARARRRRLLLGPAEALLRVRATRAKTR